MDNPSYASDRTAVRVLRLKHLQERIGLSRSTIYDRMNSLSPRYDKNFPKPFRLGGTAVGWLESEVNNWIYGKSVEKSNSERMRGNAI